MKGISLKFILVNLVIALVIAIIFYVFAKKYFYFVASITVGIICMISTWLSKIYKIEEIQNCKIKYKPELRDILLTFAIALFFLVIAVNNLIIALDILIYLYFWGFLILFGLYKQKGLISKVAKIRISLVDILLCIFVMILVAIYLKTKYASTVIAVISSSLLLNLYASFKAYKEFDLHYKQI